MGNGSGQFPIDAAVQPDNSGGPIYDMTENILGIAVAQLPTIIFTHAPSGAGGLEEQTVL